MVLVSVVVMSTSIYKYFNGELKYWNIDYGYYEKFTDIESITIYTLTCCNLRSCKSASKYSKVLESTLTRIESKYLH